MSDRSGASEAQVAELFEKIQKMMETNKRPREIQDRMYTQLRREVSMKDARRTQGGRQEIEMAVVPDGKPEASRRTYIPKGLCF